MELIVNEQRLPIAPDWQDERLLWVLREHLGLVGSKHGCGVGQCGACTVLLDGVSQRSCLLPARAAVGRQITTVEGLAGADGVLHPVQQAWLDQRVPQCGYCQAGQIVATVALLREHPRPSDAQIDAALAGHLCRCGTHQRVRAAVHAAVSVATGSGTPR